MTLPFIVESEIVQETCMTTGLTPYILHGATAGYFSFSDSYNDGDSLIYRVTDTADVEVAHGVFTGSSITRGAIITSSNNNDAVSWSGMTRQIIRPVMIVLT